VEDVASLPTIRRPRARTRRTLPRVLALLVGGAVLAGTAYLVARETSLFALRTIDVRGVPGPVAEQAREALAPFLGHSLASVDTGAITERLAALPTVRSATVDRDFPHTLRLELRAERPVAVVRHGDEAWVVSARGRVMQVVESGTFVRLPRIWLTEDVPAPRPGVFLLPDEGGLVVHTLGRIPDDFPVRVSTARGTPDDLVLVVDDTKAELRLGEAVEVRLKLAVAATVLESLSIDERQNLAYLDVSLPTRPVVSLKSQLESQT
jgi:cell division protein FtsQ